MTRYAIIEDNTFAMQHLRMEIGRLRPEWTNVFTGKSIDETVRFLKEGNNVDLIFMDIELTDGECFEIFDRVDTDVPVIFTTAYSDFAIRAFKVNGIGYLLKPVSARDLADALSKFEYLRAKMDQPHTPDAKEEGEKSQGNPANRILTVSGDRYDYINIDDICYFVSEESYVFACLNDGKRKLINLPNLTRPRKSCLKKTSSESHATR